MLYLDVKNYIKTTADFIEEKFSKRKSSVSPIDYDYKYKFVVFYKNGDKVDSEVMDLTRDLKHFSDEQITDEKVKSVVTDVLKYFNGSLKPDEKPRKFISVHKFELQIKLTKL